MRTFVLTKDLPNAPAGLKGELVNQSHGIVAVRWIYPVGTHLKNKPDVDLFSEAEFKELFKEL